jgi:hypothetical protein
LGTGFANDHYFDIDPHCGAITSSAGTYGADSVFDGFTVPDLTMYRTFLSIVNDIQVLGVGAGQMSRIDSTLIAINKAKQNNLELKKSVMASDAFFPFVDCVQAAAKEGVLGVIQPGGSINDQQVIDEINKKGMFMVFTNKRHFYH